MCVCTASICWTIFDITRLVLRVQVLTGFVVAPSRVPSYLEFVCLCVILVVLPRCMPGYLDT